VRGKCFALVKLKKFCHTQDLSKNDQLQASVNCSCLCSLHFLMVITNAKACQSFVKKPLWNKEQPNTIARHLGFLFNNKFKAFNTLLNSAEYNITWKSVSKNVA
jgi:hypothetical protein